MAGAGVRLFVSGEVVYAADVNNYLMDQVVAKFATPAIRDAAFGDGVPISVGGTGKPQLSAGRFCFLTSSTNDGLGPPVVQYYNGTSWVDSSQFTTPDNSITTAKLVDDAVTSDKIAENAINSSHIAPGTVITSDIANGSVDSTKLASGLTLTGTTKLEEVVESINLMSAPSGTVHIDATSGGVHRHSGNAAANFVINIRGASGTPLNTILSENQSITVVYIANCTNAAGYPTNVTVDSETGGSTTLKWFAGAIPTSGNSGSLDVYTFTVIKTGSNAFTVLASQARFG